MRPSAQAGLTVAVNLGATEGLSWVLGSHPLWYCLEDWWMGQRRNEKTATWAVLVLCLEALTLNQERAATCYRIHRRGHNNCGATRKACVHCTQLGVVGKTRAH